MANNSYRNKAVCVRVTETDERLIDEWIRRHRDGIGRYSQAGVLRELAMKVIRQELAAA